MANYPSHIISAALQQTTPVSYFDDKRFQVLNAMMIYWAKRFIEIKSNLDAGITNSRYNEIMLDMVKHNYFATSSRVRKVMTEYEAN